MKEIIKRLVEVFLICHFMISMGIGISGSIMEQGTVFRYEVLFEPAIMALFCTFPTLITIHNDELSMKQLIIRKIIQILMVEGIVLSLIYLGTGRMHSVREFLFVFIVVLVVFGGVSLIDWINRYIEAKQLNDMLLQMQDRNRN